MVGDQFSETIEMILLDVNPQKATLYYFNSEGEQGKMKGSIVEDQLKLESEQWRFEGRFSLNDNIIRGVWFIKEENNENWIKLIEITLEKKS